MEKRNLKNVKKIMVPGIIRGTHKLSQTSLLSKTKKCIRGKKIGVHVSWPRHLNYTKETKQLYRWGKKERKCKKKWVGRKKMYMREKNHGARKLTRTLKF